jgi:pimeloyl-ACP methyl ester carboxylesterase
MQRRALEVTAGWDDVEEREFDPPSLDRLAEIRAPTMVLVGALDPQAVHGAARRLAVGIAGARRVDWPGTAHRITALLERCWWRPTTSGRSLTAATSPRLL